MRKLECLLVISSALSRKRPIRELGEKATYWLAIDIEGNKHGKCKQGGPLQRKLHRLPKLNQSLRERRPSATKTARSKTDSESQHWEVRQNHLTIRVNENWECTVCNAFMGKVVHSWAKEWALGCVTSHSVARETQVSGFPQPMAGLRVLQFERNISFNTWLYLMSSSRVSPKDPSELNPSCTPPPYTEIVHALRMASATAATFLAKGRPSLAEQEKYECAMCWE